ncbi:MAG TPA: ADP-ribosylation factor-like protein [Candidatus Lokiarchaeia archaeon]|nr:ADP-ribosylation factor-like protein [Candidatus Lokiarchaeia archaeon]
MSLFDIFRRKTNAKAVFIGLDSAGKSTIIDFLREGRFIQHTPTMGKRKLEIDVEGTRISMFDMGGQQSFRDLWFGEIKTSKCVVFVIDEAAPHRFEEARMELEKLLPEIKKNSIKLLIIANKHDLPNAVSISEIIETFGLLDLDNFEILEISAKTGYGMANAFAKFYSMLTGKLVKKLNFAGAISVFTSGGVPIITECDQNRFERVALEGGFLSVITQFSQMKLPEEEGETQFILFESRENGTFIVARSKDFIGSLLWYKDLGVTVEQSKIALGDLLNHLENSCADADQDTISFHVEHYVSNIM